MKIESCFAVSQMTSVITISSNKSIIACLMAQFCCGWVGIAPRNSNGGFYVNSILYTWAIIWRINWLEQKACHYGRKCLSLAPTCWRHCDLLVDAEFEKSGLDFPLFLKVHLRWVCGFSFFGCISFLWRWKTPLLLWLRFSKWKALRFAGRPFQDFFQCWTEQ